MSVEFKEGIVYGNRDRATVTTREEFALSAPDFWSLTNAKELWKALNDELQAYWCPTCGRHNGCPCHFDIGTEWHEYVEHHRSKSHPIEQFMLLDGGPDFQVSLILNPKTVDRYDGSKTIDAQVHIQPTVDLQPIAVTPIVSRPKNVRQNAAKLEKADDVGLKTRPESSNEFKLTNPTEKTLRGRRR